MGRLVILSGWHQSVLRTLGPMQARWSNGDAHKQYLQHSILDGGGQREVRKIPWEHCLAKVCSDLLRTHAVNRNSWRMSGGQFVWDCCEPHVRVWARFVRIDATW